MPRLFNRIISFEVTGEIYDTETKPEDILRNYEWRSKYIDSDSISIIANHHDKRGKITGAYHLPKIEKASQPDSEYFLI